ncbi:hypothetical protein D043_4852A, partial [Vibrio parahaemolyticus EKP-021]
MFNRVNHVGFHKRVNALA